MRLYREKIKRLSNRLIILYAWHLTVLWSVTVRKEEEEKHVATKHFKENQTINYNLALHFQISQLPFYKKNKSILNDLKTVALVPIKMKFVSFNVKLPDKYYKFTLNKSRKCTNIEPIECSIAVAGIARNITPNQLVYAVKEFNLLKRFRRHVFHILKHLNTEVCFFVIEPPNGGLIDYAW